MKFHMRALALLVTVPIAGAGRADTPLLPPSDYVTTTGGVTVTADYSADTTRITRQ